MLGRASVDVVSGVNPRPSPLNKGARLQRVLEILEQRTLAQLLGLQADVRSCGRQQNAAISAVARARARVLAQPQLAAFQCFALTAFTAQAATAVARQSDRCEHLLKQARQLMEKRSHWRRCRIGLQRRAARDVYRSC